MANEQNRARCGRLCALLLVVGGTHVNCGGGAAVDDDLQARITAAAYDKACDEADDFLQAQYSGNYFVQALCTAAAVEGNTDAQTCGEELDACINNPPPEIQAGIDVILSQAGCDLLDLDPTTCSSTLGAVKACLDAIDDEVASLKYTLTCAAAGQTLDSWDLVSLPSECTFEADC